ncbi:MAG TPA: glutaredoxin family protein [Xanthomonadales bacterium]|nr:glutaredoxin family protein [Xanthomonadales bacterium]
MTQAPMTKATQIILYTRPDCHLCELAEDMLEQCQASWYPIDIETDLELIRKYGNHIPVLHRPDKDQALFWPFTGEAVRAFIDLEI